jgi:hypothetical protein
VDIEPLTGLFPDQAPEAVQDVALVEDQVKLELLPLATVLGLALMLTVAVGFGLTVTVVDWAALPPLPLHVNVYVAFADSAPVDCDPLIGLAPDQAPDAVHELAFVVAQVKVELLPVTKELGFAFRLTVGAGVFTDTVADCAALPPAPVQVKV